MSHADAPIMTLAAYLLVAGRAGGEMGLKVVQLLEEVLLGEVAVLLGSDVSVVLKHANDLHVFDLTGKLLNFFLEWRKNEMDEGHFFDG